jgi:phage terminase large subunit-like protein
MRLAAHIRKAIVAGPTPKPRDWRAIKDITALTCAEQLMLFGETYVKIPQGQHAGSPLKVALFQEVFLRAVFDNAVPTREAILSMARRNSKTFTTALVSLGYVAGPFAEANAIVASAANSRDQAGLVFKDMSLMLAMSPALGAVTKVVPSQKHVVGLVRNTEYYAMSADARTGYGKSLKVVILDEAGQIVGPETTYVSMLRSSQGSHRNPLFLTISTQAPSDADYLSVLIDDAIRTQDPRVVCHLYETPRDADLLDEKSWLLSNPALADKFRSIVDLRDQLTQAERIPAREANARNLLLNQRVALTGLWLAPRAWKENAGEPVLEVFRNAEKVALGLDLSARLDLTSATLAALDRSGLVHLWQYTFTPAIGVEDRSARDRAPYAAWVRDGLMIAVPGESISYEWVCQFLKKDLEEKGIRLTHIAFDRWRIDLFKADAQRAGFAQACEWQPVGQGFRDQAPRLDLFEELLLAKRIRHGGHPLLNLGASNAIAVADPSGNRKLDKAKATQRIDTMISAIMATYSVAYDDKPAFDVSAIVG